MAFFVGMPHQAHTNANFHWDDRAESGPTFSLSTSAPIDPANLPTSATRTRGKQLPDIFPMPGFNAVSERFRALVERFEPNTHFFHPVVLKEKDGSQAGGPHYIFSARVALDCILLARSGIAWQQHDGHAPFPDFRFGSWETHPPAHPKSRARQEAKHGIAAYAAARGILVEAPRHLQVSRPAIEGHHLWTGAHFLFQGLWLSDAFYRAFEQERIKYLMSHAHGFEIDEPWLADRELAPLAAWREAQGRSRS